MKDLVKGKRHISLLQMLVTLTALLACVALILFGLDARSTAKQSQRVAQHAINTERAILTVIVSACKTRLVTDRQVLDLADRVHNFGKALDDVTAQTTLPPGLDAQTKRNYLAQVQAIRELNTGTLALSERQLTNNCPRYQAVLDTLPVGTSSGNGGTKAP